jgi:hypothetical protein
MPFRNVIIAFFAHWTGYASDGKKTGISSNATAGRIEDYLCKHYPDWMDDYYDNGLHMKLIHKVMDICKETYDPPSHAPIYVRKQMQLAWPKVEKFLETTPLIDDNAEFVENTNPQWESKKQAITFNKLKNLLKENGAYLRDIFWRVEELLDNGCPGSALALLDKYEDELRSKYEADYIRLRRKVEAEIIP